MTNWTVVWAVIAGMFALVTALSHLTKILEFFGVRPAAGLRAKVILSLYARDPLVHLFVEESAIRQSGSDSRMFGSPLFQLNPTLVPSQADACTDSYGVRCAR